MASSPAPRLHTLFLHCVVVPTTCLRGRRRGGDDPEADRLGRDFIRPGRDFVCRLGPHLREPAEGSYYGRAALGRHAGQQRELGRTTAWRADAAPGRRPSPSAP